MRIILLRVTVTTYHTYRILELGNWEIGKLGNWEIGKLGNWEIGKLGNWEIGKLGNWESRVAAYLFLSS